MSGLLSRADASMYTSAMINKIDNDLEDNLNRTFKGEADPPTFQILRSLISYCESFKEQFKR